MSLYTCGQGTLPLVSVPFEAEQRRQAVEKYEAGEYRAALHLWDSLDYPEQMSSEEVEMFETARLRVAQT